MKIPKIDKKTLMNTTAVKKFGEITSSNVFVSFVAKAVCTIILWLGALIPLWIYLITRWAIEPVNFWQEFAIFVVCAVVIGWLQVFLVIVGFVITFIILFEDI